MRRPELLAPAGSPEALRAAVQCGADAVYLGWGDFNARRNARNFSDEEFAGAVAYCHTYGVRLFLTLNTLLSDRELPRALETARTACRLGVDAVLVQDWGLLRLLRSTLPDLPVHASTQMSIFTSGGANEAVRLGCERVVLARECSREDVAAICGRCPGEIEVFVHGALCMCYSGQCALSAAVGGRSGNRGGCAQPCRLSYRLNGGRVGYPLSLKDSCLAGELQDMAALGVACLKLEGRMKRPEYVAVVTGVYDRLLWEGRKPTQAEQEALEQAFSRSGFTQGYWQGRRGPGLFGTRPEDAREPKALFAAAKAAYDKGGLRTVPVSLRCEITAGAPCTLTAADHDGHTVTVTGPVPEGARNHALTEEELSQRLSKTGGTAYRCQHVEAEVAPGLSLPASAINALRRDALAALTAERTAPPLRREGSLPSLPEASCPDGPPRLTVSVAAWSQVTRALLELEPARIYVPLEELADRTALPEGKTAWYAILPRVWRDRDEARLRHWLAHARSLGVAGVLLGNLGQFSLVRDSGLYISGDLGLNVFNSHALALLRDMGADTACVSFELRFSQIRDLKKCLPTEALVYGRLPLMITEHCLYQNETGCALDKAGAKVPDTCPCGQSVALVDRTGAAFPLLPAYGHRTELQNSRPLWLADLPDWKHLGLTYGRLRFTVESPSECVSILRTYQTGGPPRSQFTRGLYQRGVQ